MSSHPFVQSRSFREFSHDLIGAEYILDRIHSEFGKSSCFFELFIESTYHRHLSMQNDHVQILSDDTDEGVGLRCIGDQRSDYVYVNHLSRESTDLLFRRIRGMMMNESGKNHFKTDYLVPVMTHEELSSSSFAEASRMVRTAHDQAWKHNWRTESVTADWEETCRSYRVIHSEGFDQSGTNHWMSLSVQAAVVDGASTYQGFAYGGGQSVGDSVPDFKPEQFAKTAVDRALRKMEARPCPSGLYPVVLAPGLCGVFIHEIIGHQTEADVCMNGLSCFSGRLGEMVASPKVTVVDDGTMSLGRGSAAIDDEGFPKQRTVLIENGKLINLLFDRQTSRIMKRPQTGSARRESYANPPLPRMSNTYLESGDDHPEELILSVHDGLYITSIGQGQADPATGVFVFDVQEGFWIHDGKITYPVKAATIMGKSSETLYQIDGVGNDLRIDTGSGYCVKDGQRIPISSGQPTVRIKNLLINCYP